MSSPLAVLVTGSAGRVGGAAAQALLARGHRVRGFDVVASPSIPDSVAGSISQAADLAPALAGIHTVVHCAATPDEDDFLQKLLPNNIVGVYHVLESARRAGVQRVILASTGQVVVGHEGPWPITPDMPCSPRNWYGSAKVFAEVAGQVYARVHGMSIIVARLGWCPRDKQHADQLAADEVGKNVYLSAADAGRFFVRAVEAELATKYCLTFVTSRPWRKTLYDLTAARVQLGYLPQDQWPTGTEMFGQW